MYAKQLKVPDVSFKFQPSPRPSLSQEARKIHLELLLDQGDMLRILDPFFPARKRGPQWPKSEQKIQGLDGLSWHGVTQVQVECQKWHSSRFGPLRVVKKSEKQPDGPVLPVRQNTCDAGLCTLRSHQTLLAGNIPTYRFFSL